MIMILKIGSINYSLSKYFYKIQIIVKIIAKKEVDSNLYILDLEDFGILTKDFYYQSISSVIKFINNTWFLY